MRFVPVIVLATLTIVAAVLMLLEQPAAAQAANLDGLSASDITTARSAPIRQGGKETNTTTWGTSPTPLYAVDVPVAFRAGTRFVQNIRITNRHASQWLCTFDVAWSGGSTCAQLCAAATTRTCNGTSTDGEPIAPGGGYGESWDGTACLCGVASGAGTLATAARVMRSPL